MQKKIRRVESKAEEISMRRQSTREKTKEMKSKRENFVFLLR